MALKDSGPGVRTASAGARRTPDENDCHFWVARSEVRPICSVADSHVRPTYGGR